MVTARGRLVMSSRTCPGTTTLAAGALCGGRCAPSRPARARSTSGCRVSELDRIETMRLSGRSGGFVLEQSSVPIDRVRRQIWGVQVLLAAVPGDGQRPGVRDLDRDVGQSAVGVLAGNLKHAECVLTGEPVLLHQDAHGYPDLPVAL